MTARAALGPAALVLLLLAGAAATAGAEEAATPATVTTSGTAREVLPNTVADVEASVDVAGKRTVAEVRTAMTAAAGPLLDYLRAAGVERLRTEEVAVRPEFDTSVSGRPPRLSGYRGRLSLRFVVEEGKLGAVLGELLARGATGIDETTLRPRQAELDAARDRLAAAATKLALAQARAVAEAAGVRAGPLRSITVESETPLPRRGGRVLAAAVMAAPPPPPPPMATEAGGSEVSASVTAVVTLREN